MNYQIVEIEGVGDAYAAKLKETGIKTVSELLEKELPTEDVKKFLMLQEYHLN